MLELLVRHLKVYTRDRMAFAMSFISVLILILVYQVFLGQVQIDALKAALNSETVSTEAVHMVNYWLIAGLTTMVSMTSTLGAFGVMIADKEKKVSEDFKVSPISDLKVDLSYTIFALLFGVIISFLTCLFAIGLFNGFKALSSFSLEDYAEILGLISLGTSLSASIILPILHFIKTSSAFTTLSTIVGTFIGFISGVYLSIGSVGETLQQVMTWFPLTQVNALLKQVLMKEAMAEVFKGASATIVENYQLPYGLMLANSDGKVLEPGAMLTYLWLVLMALFVAHLILKKIRK